MSRLDRFRTNKNTFFNEHENSPLTAEQRVRFKQLEYFPENERLRFEVTLDTDGVSQDPVTMGTTTGEPKEFVPAGWAHLDIEGESIKLMVFKEPGRGRLFLPFRDGNAGAQTYMVGRYLDPQSKPDGTVIIDFNMAYNPYCAYNDNFACPIAPFENVTKTRINAGEKSYPDKV